MAKVIVLATLLLMLVACSGPPPRNEQTGMGYVRSTRWGDRHAWGAVIHENEFGFVKQLYPICDDALPVWAGMRANIGFHWDSAGCFRIDWALRG